MSDLHSKIWNKHENLTKCSIDLAQADLEAMKAYQHNIITAARNKVS